MKTTISEKINLIRTNDKVNDMIEKTIELLQELKYYIDDFDEEDSDKKIEELITIFEAKDRRNTNESKRLCTQIINEQNAPEKKINEKEVY